MIDNYNVQVYKEVVHLVPNFEICHNNFYRLCCVTLIRSEVPVAGKYLFHEVYLHT